MDNQTKDTPKPQKNKWIGRIIVLVLLLAAVLCYFSIPPVNSAVGQVFDLLSSMDVEAVAAYIRSFGGWAAAISFLLMILQSIAAPVPAFLLTFANAAIFGWWKGAILSWSSAMAGAAVCFFIARILGRDVVVKLTSKGALKSVDVFFERYGKNAILICRLLPFVSFDLISYGAGLTGIGFWSFFWATGLGQLPATVVYSYVGGMLTGGTQLFVTALLVLFALTALVFLIKTMYNNRHKNRHKDEGPKARQAEGKGGK